MMSDEDLQLRLQQGLVKNVENENVVGNAELGKPTSELFHLHSESQSNFSKVTYAEQTVLDDVQCSMKVAT